MYRIYKQFVAGDTPLVVTEHDQYGTNLWTLTKGNRKGQTCANCKVPFGRGIRMWRPLSNGYNRMERLCVRCVDKAEPGRV